LRYRQGTIHKASEYQQAENYFLKALSINHNLIISLNYLSGIYTEIGIYDKAMDLVNKALFINPNYAHTHFQLSYIYRYTGCLIHSREEAEKALEIDSNNKRFRSIGHTYRYLGEYDKAVEIYNLDEGSAYVFYSKGVSLLRNGKKSKALGFFNRAIEKEPDKQWGLASAALKAYIEGSISKGLVKILEWEEADPFDSEGVYQIASLYGLLGDAKGCIRMLNKAVQGGFFCYPFFLIDPFLDPVRDDPEFQEVLALAIQKHEAFKQKYFSD